MFLDDSKKEEYRMIQPDGTCFEVEGFGFGFFGFFPLYGGEYIGVRKSILEVVGL